MHRPILSLFAASLALAVSALAQEAPPVEIALKVPVDQWTPLAQPPDYYKGLTGIEGTATVGGKAEPFFLPVSADTFIGGPTAWGDKDFVATRKGSNGHNIFLKFDTSSLPSGAQVDAASLVFLFNDGRSKQVAPHRGAFTISVHEVTTPWSEQSTATDSGLNLENWKMPALGNGIEKVALASKEFSAEAPASKDPQQIEGLKSLVQGWVDGQTNDGLALLVTGSAQGFALASRESVLSRRPAFLNNDGAALATVFPLLQLRTVMLKPSDLLKIKIQLNFDKTNPKQLQAMGGAEVVVRSAPEKGGTQKGEVLAKRPVTDIDSKNVLALEDPAFTKAVLAGIKGNAEYLPLTVSLENGNATATLKLPPPHPMRPMFRAEIVKHPSHSLFDPAIHPQDGVYTERRGGNFYYDGKRLRLWGVVIRQRLNLELLTRVKDMGFNAIRLWSSTNKFYTDGEDATGAFLVPVKGDNSELDLHDRFIFEAKKKHGLFIMATSTMDLPPIGEKSLWLKSFGKGEADWDAWLEAMKTAPKSGWSRNVLAIADERVFEARKRHIKNYLEHLNPYTGKTYAEEESFFVYELGNEDNFVKRMLDYGFDKWPTYFRDKLAAKWNDWLIKKYGSEAKITAAWGGLAQGDTPGKIALAPLLKQAADYSPARLEDFVRFLTEQVMNMQRQYEDYARSFGPKGKGVNTASFSIDTQYQPNSNWAYTSTVGDVANFGMYFWAMTSALTAPPAMFVMDSYSEKDKPTVIYETMGGRPNPYRAEYPFRVAALASWQDWDAIFFHYWMGILDNEKTFENEHYLLERLTYVDPKHFWSAVYFCKDPTLLTGFATAGQMFINGDLPAATDPVTYRIGDKGIFTAEAFKGLSTGTTTFSQGAQLEFVPGGDFDVQVVPAKRPDGQAWDTPPQAAVQSGEGIFWDWPNGRLIIDTPKAKAYIGKPMGNYRFRDGIVVGGFEGDFISWSMVSKDNKPLTGLGASREIFVNAAFESRNHGAILDPKRNVKPHGRHTNPTAMGLMVVDEGTLPVEVLPAPFHVWFPNGMEATLKSYDFALRETNRVAVKTNDISPVNARSYMHVLAVDKWTAPAEAPASKTFAEQVDAGVESLKSASQAKPLSPKVEALAKALGALPKVDALPRMGAKISDVTSLLDEQGLKPQSFIPPGDPNQLILSVNGASLALDSQASINFLFQEGVLDKIEVTFTRPPIFSVAMSKLEGLLGKPVSSNISETAFAASKVVWKATAGQATLDATLNEVQGMMTIEMGATSK